MSKAIFYLFLVVLTLSSYAQTKKTQIAGVFKGKTLFIQNPYDPNSKSFCIQSLELNGKSVTFNQSSSAIKLDFETIDEYAPVHILMIHSDYCDPVVINPDAIDFHSVFAITEIDFQDSVFVWKTKGEEKGYTYVIEKYDLGIWTELERIEAQGQFGGATYMEHPLIDVGANKLRVKSEMNNGAYVYSDEVDFHFYPEPVTFSPFATDKIITFSRTANYEVFDAGGDLVMSGQGNTLDVSPLPRGNYVIYFDGEDPGMFQRK